jgi:hypothetical protein
MHPRAKKPLPEGTKIPTMEVKIQSLIPITLGKSDTYSSRYGKGTKKVK